MGISVYTAVSLSAVMTKEDQEIRATVAYLTFKLGPLDNFLILPHELALLVLF